MLLCIQDMQCHRLAIGQQWAALQRCLQEQVPRRGGAYSWQFDDAKALRTCSKADYDITLCPASP